VTACGEDDADDVETELVVDCASEEVIATVSDGTETGAG